MVLTAGDSTNVNNFGGTPGRLIDALCDAGIDASGLDLRWRFVDTLVRSVWAAWAVISRFETPRGFQWSLAGQWLRDWRFSMQSRSPAVVISFFQNPPRRLKRGSDLVLYVDGTLTNLFNEYPEVANVPDSIKRSALVREANAYGRARFIVTKTKRAANSLVTDYLVSPSRIVIIPPPPNLDIAFLESAARSRLEPIGGVLRLVAIAKDYERKNVKAAVEFVDQLIHHGVSASLTLVGLTQSDVPESDRRPWLQPLGVVGHDSRLRLEQVLAESHVGLLFSKAEIAGISLLEYQRAGLLVYCSGRGGMPDVLLTDQCEIVDITDSDSLNKSASVLALSVLDGKLSCRLRAAWEQRTKVPLWNEVVQTITSKLDDEYSEYSVVD